jgi:hypothetical protein
MTSLRVSGMRFAIRPKRKSGNGSRAGSSHGSRWNVRAEGKVAYDRYSDEGGVSGRDGSIKSIELSGAYQYR